MITPYVRSTDPRWQKVAGAFLAVGVTPFLDDEVLPGAGVVYVDRKVALASDPFEYPEYALHDLGHYLVCPRERRLFPNYGLGPHPVAAEDVNSAEAVKSDRIFDEESASSVLNILLTEVLFGEPEAREVAGYLNVHPYPRRHTDLSVGARKLLARARLFVPGTLLMTLPADLREYLQANGQGNLQLLGPAKPYRRPPISVAKRTPRS